MTTITIPKKMTGREELIVLPRKKYEELLRRARGIKTFKPTTAQKQALEKARLDFRRGKYISWEHLKHELVNRPK